MSFPLANDPSWDLFYARHWLHIEIEKTWPLLLASSQREVQTGHIKGQTETTKSKAPGVDHGNTKRGDVCAQSLV